ncbi:hypothetical protein [Acidisoma sp. C75]
MPRLSRLSAFALLAPLGLAGCATGPSLAQQMHALVGQPEQVIVQQLGVPNRSITAGGITYLAYQFQNTQVIPSGGFGFGWGGYDGWANGFYAPPPTVIVTGCEATFQMGPGDVAVAVVLRGNDCG